MTEQSSKMQSSQDIALTHQYYLKLAHFFDYQK